MVGQANLAGAETASDEPGGRIGNVVLWVVQAVLALVFAGSGISKLAGDGSMVDMFADIGAGQWLRHLVGTCEALAVVGLLVPRLAGAAALGLVALMVGATLTNVLVLHVSPAFTLVLLAAAAVVAWDRWRVPARGGRMRPWR